MSKNPTQQELSDFVRANVDHCVSSLVYTLAQGYGDKNATRDLDELCEQAFELSTPALDHESAAEEHIRDMSRDECVEYLESLSIECRDDETVAELREAVLANAKEEGIEEFCSDHDIEPHECEVYEHWIVSDWLAPAETASLTAAPN